MSTVLLRDLTPGQTYSIQVRSDDGAAVSDWSPIFTFTANADATPPDVPTSLSLVVNGDTFVANWTGVNKTLPQNLDFLRYEVAITAGATTLVVPTVDTSYTLTFATNRQMFTTPQPVITMKVRAVDSSGNASAYTSPQTATNPAPGPVTGLTANTGTDSIDLTWTPPSDNDLIGYNVYTGATSGFTPSGANKIGFTASSRFSYTTTTYTLQWFKVRAVDEFGQESTDATTSATPTSPFVVDVTAPATPTALAGTITNNANGIGARIAVTWTMTSPPSDLAGFNLRYRKTGDTNWQYMNAIDQGDRAATLVVDLAYTAYDLQIQAYDFSDNKSAWSSTASAAAVANTAPANVTGLAATPGKDSIIYSWTAVADQDISTYEVTFSTSPTFASGNITYFTGQATTLTVGGLTGGTIYYARVRAKDTGGLTSASFSSTVNATTGTIAATDGSAPTSSPTPSVTGRLNSLYITWTPITNNDPVTYEVHLSTTTGFTPSGATKVTEISGASAMVSNLPGTTTALSYGTTYFIKLIAKDADGAAAAGTQGSGSITKVASTDVTSIGADLIVPGTGFVNALVVNTGGSIQSSNYVASTTGWKIAPTGIEMNDANSTIKVDALRAGTIGGVSGAGAIQVAAGTSINMNGGYLKSNTYTGTSQASNPSGAGFYLGDDGLRIDTGKISAAAFSGGSFSTGTITMSGGSITGGSWTLNSSGLTIPNGGINAASLNLQTGDNLLPPEYSDFEASISAYTGTNALVTVISGTAAVISSQYYFNSQALQWVTTNTSNEIALASSVIAPVDYNMQLNPGSSYILSAYVMQPVGASSIQVNPRVQYKGGNVTNLLTNGDFEATPSNSNWTTNGTIGTVSTAQVTQRRTGFKGQQLTQAVTGADTYISQTVTVSPNTTYTFGAHRIVNTVLTGGALSNRSLYWIDNGTGSGASAAVLNATTTTGTWIRDSVTFTTSATASTVTLRLYAPNGTVFWDNATLVAGSTDVFDYFVDLGVNTVPSDGNWARYSWTFAMPSTGTTGASFLGFRTVNGTLGTLNIDGIQVEEQLGSVTTPSSWKPPSSTTIDGGIIRTGSIISSSTTTVNSVVIPTWSIPLNGAASFANLQVRGSAVFGNPTGGVIGGTDLDAGATTVSSANYIAGTQGWQLRSDGTGEFVNLGASTINGANVRAGTLDATTITSSTLTSDIVISGSFTTALNSVQLPTFATTSGSAAVTVLAPDQFYPDDVGSTITSANLPANTTIIAYLSATSVTVSANATATSTDSSASILRNRRVVIDSNGVTLITQSNNAIIVLPTDPSIPATFNGVVNANTLSVSDYFYMGGINNALQTNAVLGLSLGTFVPSAPQLTPTYDTMSSFYSGGFTGAGSGMRGYFYDATNAKAYAVGHSNQYFSTVNQFVYPMAYSNLGGWDGVTLIYPQGIAKDETIYSIASDATNFYVLTAGTGSGYKLYTMTRTNFNNSANWGLGGVPVASTTTLAYSTFGNTSGSITPMAMTVYGGNIYVAARRGDTNKMQLSKYTGLNFSTLAFSSQPGSYSGSTDIMSLTVGKFDMGGTNVYAAVGAWGANRPATRMVLVGVSSFTWSQTLDFQVPTAASTSIGTTYVAATTDTSSGVFSTYGTKFWTFTGFGGTTTGTNFNATMKWRNDNTGGGTAGVGPSSPVTTVSLASVRRSKVVFTSPKTIPNAGGNTPNSVSFYAGVDAGTKWHYPELATNIISGTYTTLQTSDAATIPAVMGVLVSGSPAQITNGTTTAGAAGALNILGDGTATFGTTSANTLKIGTSGARMTGVNYGNTTANTNASGQITIAHGLGVNPVSVVALPGSNHQLQLASKDATNMVFTCYTRPGVILGTGVSVQILWAAVV